ncbi:hypothetical protein BJ944DRAFT_262875 [Cunninghamella echinulata]|nr:hypothetical protein BJ944DRAFT_262875 [Cunninghamella echinulata]
MINVDTSILEIPSIINIKITQEKGREYVANQVIEKQTTLLKVFPYATAIFDSFKKRICAYCLCTHPSKSFSTHCLSCDQVYFCSSVCAHTYLADHRTDICESLRKLATLKKVDKNMKSIGKLILMIYWQRQKEISSSSTANEIKIKNNNEKEDKTATIEFDLVNQLESHYDAWSLDMKKDWSRLHTFLLKQLHQSNWILPHESDIDIMHLASKIESNGFGIYLENKLDVLAGRAIYPLASLFNHDCDFNCEVEQWTEEDLEEEKIKQQITDDDGQEKEPIFTYPSVFKQAHGKFRQMMIRTVQDVQEGEALTIGYIDTNIPVSSRRQRLLQDYYFTCQCQRCIKESSQIASFKKKKNKRK